MLLSKSKIYEPRLIKDEKIHKNIMTFIENIKTMYYCIMTDRHESHKLMYYASKNDHQKIIDLLLFLEKNYYNYGYQGAIEDMSCCLREFFVFKGATHDWVCDNKKQSYIEQFDNVKFSFLKT